MNDTAKKQANPAIVGILVLLIVGLLGWAMCATSGEDEPDLEVSGTVTGFQPVDEANLEVFLEMTNEGSKAAKVECTVTAFDASQSSVGFDILSSRQPVGPGDSERFQGVIRIEDEGAFRVQDVKARKCGEAF